MAPTFSRLGIYLKRADSGLDEIFYHTLPNRTGWMVEVPHVDVRRKPRVVKTDIDPAWIPVGSYNDDRFDVVITTKTLARQLQRVAEALLTEIDSLKRDKDWYAGRLGAGRS